MKITLGSFFTFETSPTNPMKYEVELQKAAFKHQVQMVKHKPSGDAPQNIYNSCVWGTPMVASLGSPSHPIPDPQRAADYLVTTLNLNPEVAMRVIEAIAQFYSDKTKP